MYDGDASHVKRYNFNLKVVYITASLDHFFYVHPFCTPFLQSFISLFTTPSNKKESYRASTPLPRTRALSIYPSARSYVCYLIYRLWQGYQKQLSLVQGCGYQHLDNQYWIRHASAF